jgi:hypothetical protein
LKLRRCQPLVNASARGRSNQHKGGFHERKIATKLGELTGFNFERNLEQRWAMGIVLPVALRMPVVISLPTALEPRGLSFEKLLENTTHSDHITP